MDLVIDAKISPDRRLIDYELPDNAPVGPVRLVIQSSQNESELGQPLTRVTARAKLLAAGRYNTESHSPDGPIHLSAAEHQRLTNLFGGDDLTMLDLVNQDRGPKP
jgi:hypothetical protein